MKKTIILMAAAAAALSMVSCDKIHKLLGEMDFSNDNLHNINVNYDWTAVNDALTATANGDPTAGTTKSTQNGDYFPLGGSSMMGIWVYDYKDNEVYHDYFNYYEGNNLKVEYWKNYFILHFENEDLGAHFKGIYDVVSMAGEYEHSQLSSCYNIYSAFEESLYYLDVRGDYMEKFCVEGLEDVVYQIDDLLVARGVVPAPCIDQKDAQGNPVEAHPASSVLMDPDMYPQVDVNEEMKLLPPVQYTIDNTKFHFQIEGNYNVLNYAVLTDVSYNIEPRTGLPTGQPFKVFAGSLHVTRDNIPTPTRQGPFSQKGGVSDPLKAFGTVPGNRVYVYDLYDVFYGDIMVGRLYRKIDVTDQVENAKYGDKVTIYLPGFELKEQYLEDNGMVTRGDCPIVEYK